jgi:hypothetical protein
MMLGRELTALTVPAVALEAFVENLRFTYGWEHVLEHVMKWFVRNGHWHAWQGDPTNALWVVEAGKDNKIIFVIDARKDGRSPSICAAMRNKYKEKPVPHVLGCAVCNEKAANTRSLLCSKCEVVALEAVESKLYLEKKDVKAYSYYDNEYHYID